MHLNNVRSLTVCDSSMVLKKLVEYPKPATFEGIQTIAGNFTLHRSTAPYQCCHKAIWNYHSISIRHTTYDFFPLEYMGELNFDL